MEGKFFKMQTMDALTIKIIITLFITEKLNFFTNKDNFLLFQGKAALILMLHSVCTTKLFLAHRWTV